jgi:hypothetical protein
MSYLDAVNYYLVRDMYSENNASEQIDHGPIITI